MSEDIPTYSPHPADTTVMIVTAFVNGNPLPRQELPDFIREVHKVVLEISGAAQVAEQTPAQEPAVPIRKSITPDFIICLEDGMKFRSLKRHLRTRYDMSPEQYREKWKLPADYPIVAPNYSAIRSQLAKDAGLGQKR
jgi:predicted transcriptional regulator